MKIAQSLMVVSLGCILSMLVNAEEVEVVTEEVSGFSVSCGYQGMIEPSKANNVEILTAFNKAATACEVAQNTDAYDFYSEKAAACTESKTNCLEADYKDMRQSWCGRKLIQPMNPILPVPMHWAQTMESLIQKAQTSCLASTDPIEVAAATAYFEDFKPGMCTDVYSVRGELEVLPEDCVAMYHALGSNGAPY